MQPTESTRVGRHCEERSDEAIHPFFRRPDGLLRFARNDEEKPSLDRSQMLHLVGDLGGNRRGPWRAATPLDVDFHPEGFPSARSEEHTSEFQSQFHLVCRLLLEKKKTQAWPEDATYQTSKNEFVLPYRQIR